VALHVTVDNEMDQSGAEQAKANVARALITALSSECSAYCMISGYEGLPESFETDIDFMVGEKDFERVPAIVEHVAQQTGTRLFHTVGHELSARSFSLGYQLGENLVIVQPDSASDYRHFGLLWLRSKEVLAFRQWHQRGFWIPAAHHEFAYYLIKRINKEYLGPEHGLKLHRLYLQDPSQCDEMISRFWRGRDRDLIRRMARTNDWSAVERSLKTLRSEMIRNSAENAVERIASSPAHLLHHMRRIVMPTGGWIAIMGPDGAGKSAVIEAIRHQFKFAYHRVQCFHLRPKMLRRGNDTNQVVTDPHGQPARGMLLSVAKVFFMIADYWLGYLLRIAPAMRRSQLMVFDRYIYDLLVDSKRVRYGGPAWLPKVAAKIVPHPNLVILLDAPPDVLWSRKQEVAFDEVRRQRDGYLEVAKTLPFATIVNAGQALPDVIRDVDQAIVNYFQVRTSQRLQLAGRVIGSDHNTVEAPGRQC
jgi:thymidylate kinase